MEEVIRTLIIDDEPLAREGIAEYVEQIPSLKVLGVCENPLEGLPYIDRGEVDLMFLDIQMPQINGIDFLKTISHPPLVIFTTAYPSYALEGYQLDALDYLVKPITFERFFKAATKAIHYHKLLKQKETQTQPSDGAYFFIKSEQHFEKIIIDEILFIEGLQNYISIYTPDQKFVTLMSMKGIMARLPEDDFVRTHKSYIINKNQVDKLSGNELHIGSYKIPISRTYKEAVMKNVLGGHLL
ncbi:MAG: LytTR family DNA-binding domain-containing protein [Bacteroidota bacterium]